MELGTLDKRSLLEETISSREMLVPWIMSTQPPFYSHTLEYGPLYVPAASSSDLHYITYQFYNRLVTRFSSIRLWHYGVEGPYLGHSLCPLTSSPNLLQSGVKTEFPR